VSWFTSSRENSAQIEAAVKLDLVVTLDDATGELYSVIPAEEEGTASSFLGTAERRRLIAIVSTRR
jgi:hypothetical protein